MNAAKAAVLALITWGAVAIPATSAHADDPFLCALLTPCDGQGGDEGGDDSEPAPVDDSADIELDIEQDVGLVADTEIDVEVDLFPDSATLLTADTDVDHAALQAAAVDRTLHVDSDAALDTDASIGHHGIVVTGNGNANAEADVTTWRRLVGVDAANQFCGVQVVIAADSSTNCDPTGSTDGTSRGDDGLIAVAESVDLCGAHVVLAGRATTDCGDPSRIGSPAAGSSWTLADAAAAGTLCGVSIAVAGESDTTCAGTAQEAPVPGADPNGSGPGTPGTGATAAVQGSVQGAAASSPDAASSPAAAGGQEEAARNDEGNSGTTVGESRGSLPLTGTSVLLLLALAAALVAAGLVAMRSAPVRSV